MSLNLPIIYGVVKAVVAQQGYGGRDEVIPAGKDDHGLLEPGASAHLLETGRSVATMLRYDDTWPVSPLPKMVWSWGASGS